MLRCEALLCDAVAKLEVEAVAAVSQLPEATEVIGWFPLKGLGVPLKAFGVPLKGFGVPLKRVRGSIRLHATQQGFLVRIFLW